MLSVRGVSVASIIAIMMAQSGAASADDIAVSVSPAPSSTIDEITVYGSAGGVNQVPGAITYISPQALDRQSYGNIQRILRLAPGVNVQEEDGYGLRPNIGLRGSGADRSSRISIQEDGVPIAPAPYSAPSAYYFPYAGRLNSVEVTKGPAVIKYGPRTSGGALNLFSTPIPEEAAAYAEFITGGDNTRRLHAWVGTRVDIGPVNAGFLIETFQYRSDGFKEIDAGGDSGFDIDDFVFKFGLYAKENARIPQSLELKYQRSDQVSDETYLGLSEADFNASSNRRYNASALDDFTSDHETFQANYHIEPVDGLEISLLAYRTEFQRDWFKIERVFSEFDNSFVTISSLLQDIDDLDRSLIANPGLLLSPQQQAVQDNFAILVGAPGFTSADDAIDLRHNARVYSAHGVQGTISYEFDTAGVRHALETSLRWHEDQEDRLQFNEFFRIEDTQLLRTSLNTPGSQTNRLSTADALSGYIQDNIDWGRFHATLGVRVEHINLVRNDFDRSDETRALGPIRVRQNSILAILPGAGIVYDATDNLSLLAGVYRGFAPPSPGSSSDEEQSWVYEAGFRFSNDAFNLEAIGYLNAFENLVGSCTASSGGGCVIGDQFDGGAVDIYGVEITAGSDLSRWIKTPFQLPVNVVYTHTNSEFKSSFDSDFAPFGDVVAGDALPYVANHQLFASLGARGERWGAEAAIVYQSARRSEAGQGAIAPGAFLDPHIVTDVSVYLEVVKGFRLRAKLENAFDETYIAARRPAGLRPGLPRTFFIGADLSL